MDAFVVIENPDDVRPSVYGLFETSEAAEAWARANIDHERDEYVIGDFLSTKSLPHGIQYGRLYVVSGAEASDYLTNGEVYRCDSIGKRSVGLHRPSDGAGTYLPTYRLVGASPVILAEVDSATAKIGAEVKR